MLDGLRGEDGIAELCRREGIAPVPFTHSAYPFMRDGDGEGMMCE